jgi:hypothetical protein
MTAAARDDHDSVDRLLHLREHMTRDQHGPALDVGEVTEQASQPDDALGVEAVRRLIDQQHSRIAEEAVARPSR